MKLGSLQELYERQGPFVTVYLDTSGDAEDASKALDLRWRSARERLSGMGVDEATLEALAERVGEHQRQTGQRGQVLVAVQGEVVLNDELPEPPEHTTDDVYFGSVPQLMPYLRLRGPHIPHLVAVIDHEGADITAVHATQGSQTHTVEGSGSPVHKAYAGGQGNPDNFHAAVEEQWKNSAKEIAQEINRLADRVHARAVVLAGDVQARKLVSERLSERTRESVVETDAGHRDRKACGESLRAEVAETVKSTVQARTAEAVEEFERERGQHDRAVEGWEDTLAALREAKLQALLWIPAAAGRRGEVAVGSRPSEIGLDEDTLRKAGVEGIDTVPADAAVIRSLAGTSGEFFLVDDDRVDLAEGIGGILRY